MIVGVHNMEVSDINYDDVNQKYFIKVSSKDVKVLNFLKTDFLTWGKYFRF